MESFLDSGLVRFVIALMAISVITALIFGGVVMTRLFQGLRALFGVSIPAGLRRRSGAVQIEPLPSRHKNEPAERLCGYELCHASNRPDARYCRRCGRPLATHYVETRRAG